MWAYGKIQCRDSILLSGDSDWFQGALNRLRNGTESINMRVNVDKTKVVIFYREENRKVWFQFEWELTDQVNGFVCVGRMLTNDGKTDKEIERRVDARRNIVDTMTNIEINMELSK